MNKASAKAACLVAAGYSLVVKAPIEVYNALPMPLGVVLSSSDPDRSPLPSHVVVQPLQSCLLHQVGAFHQLEAVQLEPMGYDKSPAMGVPQGPPPRNRCAPLHHRRRKTHLHFFITRLRNPAGY